MAPAGSTGRRNLPRERAGRWDWQAVIDLHPTGHFNVNRAAINLFREQNYGRLILVSSTSPHNRLIHDGHRRG